MIALTIVGFILTFILIGIWHTQVSMDRCWYIRRVLSIRQIEMDHSIERLTQQQSNLIVFFIFVVVIGICFVL